MPRVSVGRAELDTRNFVLYRYFDRMGVLLYVGITVDLRAREAKHSRHAKWWLRVDHEATILERYIGERAARTAETAAIKTEKPLENDQHNEFVDHYFAPASADVIGDLYEDITGYLAHDGAVKDLEHEFRGDHPYAGEEEIRAKICSSITRDLWLQRADLAKTAFQMLTLLPDGLGERCRDAAYDELKKHGDGREFDRAKHAEETLREITKALAVQYLDRLDKNECDEWLACAKTFLPDADEVDVILRAADFAAEVKAGRAGFMTGMCANSGDHGAMCPSLAAHKVWIEDCRPCSRTKRPCRGHDGLCDRHLAEAVEGKAVRSDGSAYRIIRSEPLRDPADFWAAA